MKKSTWSLYTLLLIGVAPLIFGLAVHFFFSELPDRHIDDRVREYAEGSGIDVDAFEYNTEDGLESGSAAPEPAGPPEEEAPESFAPVAEAMSTESMVLALQILREMDASAASNVQERSQMSEWLMLIGGINSMLMGWATLFLRRRETE